MIQGGPFGARLFFVDVVSQNEYSGTVQIITYFQVDRSAHLELFLNTTELSKAAKAAMNYQDKPKGDRSCSDCKFFVPGKMSTANGTCQVVKGSIGPPGWCAAYTKKS